MTCKDCMHYDVCSALCTGIDMNVFMKDDNTTASESCTDFKDKSKFVELRKGKWIPKKEMVREPYARNYECSICGFSPIEVYHFCQNCGADMRGDNE